jgi:hypothetical protein
MSGATFIVWLESLFVIVPAPELGDALRARWNRAFWPVLLRKLTPRGSRLAGDVPSIAKVFDLQYDTVAYRIMQD